MNIFVLDSDPEACARAHVDKHVVKMPLETAQMLCTITRQHGGEARYQATHLHHPCTRWAGESTGNYAWLVQLGLALCAEYTYRYGKRHASGKVIREMAPLPQELRIAPRGAFALAMPEEYKKTDAVESYRDYYRGEKQHLHSWKKKAAPLWINFRREEEQDE